MEGFQEDTGISACVASASSAGDVPPQRTSMLVKMRNHPAALCAVAVVATVGCAFAVAGLADMAASSSNTNDLARRLRTPELELEPSFPEDESAPERNLNAPIICSADSQWLGLAWADLSLQEKNSWQLLGWFADVWDATWGAAEKGKTTPTTTDEPTTTLFGQITTTVTTTSYIPMTELTLCWEDLTEDMRDGATALGYSITKWSECKKRGCDWPKGIPDEDAACLTHMRYFETKYNETRVWANITQLKRNNLALLGWDPDGKLWKDGLKPQTYGRQWSELTVREREAATFLGYDYLTWETCEKALEKGSSCVKRMVHLEAKMRTWVWEELLLGTQLNLGTLGWQSRTWFEGEMPPVMKADWIGLTSAQRTAARILGYTQDTWAQCPDAECPERFEYVEARWSTVGWMEMTLSERRAWMLLGHSESLWNDGNNPYTMQKRWSELSPEQQRDAQYLGHTEETWQGCNVDWQGRNGTDDNETFVDPSGAVRARMHIDRPYSEVSGNVYGKQVANMPTSFIRVFENSVGRALFCGNPPLSFNPLTYIDADGEPLCLQKTNFEREKYRVRVLNVVEGSIVIDFFIVANVTPAQTTARLLFEKLVRQVDAKETSPLCHDKYFGRYAVKASVKEMKMNSLTLNQMLEALDFEQKRNYYDESRACLLKMDGKSGITSCGTSSARGQPRFLFALDLAGPLLAFVALFIVHP